MDYVKAEMTAAYAWLAFEDTFARQFKVLEEKWQEFVYNSLFEERLSIIMLAREALIKLHKKAAEWQEKAKYFLNNYFYNKPEEIDEEIQQYAINRVYEKVVEKIETIYT
ncbi:hypothetical protein [Listeria costaricensis]|uniref:hypothetical protein n=1 Tax=Listeria costaricensis TaxID=2026604 RepID=UPI000C0829EB|nr:hypothetical protein [Listeria costaricensis]